MTALTFHVADSPDRVAALAAAHVAAGITEAVAARGDCRLALAGGRTPVALHAHLVQASSTPWDRVRVFFGDERCVAPTDAQSNYRMARETLLDPLQIPADRVHRIPAERGGSEAARDYATTLGGVPLDVVVLGMGDDGHTASLFPDTPALADETAWVVPTASPVPPVGRVSLALPALWAARQVVFVVTGAAKAHAFAAVRAEVERGTPRLPAACVAARRPTTWFVDRAAAGAPAPRGGRPEA